MTTDAFEGFPRAGIDFLAGLAANNDRAWFTPRKAEYERLLKRPLEALCAALAERFSERGIPLVSDPVGSPFRIYRDVRFSRDKSPYKTNVSASFPWRFDGPGTGAVAPGSGSGPAMRHVGGGGYFTMGAGEISIGGGMWHPEPARRAAWRALVLAEPGRVLAVLDEPGFVAEFRTVGGERLARVPRGLPPDHPEADLLRLKDVIFGRRLSDDEAFSPRLPDAIADSLEKAVPLLRLLAELPVEAGAA
jgi:uncharacterized protein (TIGR02453 family)